jgi:hypothetical protein
MPANVFATEAGQFLYGAHRYLSAARLLRFSETWQTDPQLIHTPTLHLLAHGIELLLKYGLIVHGDSQAVVARRYGHDLALLWAAPANTELRDLVLSQSETVWRIAQGSGQYQDAFSGDPRQVLVDALSSLSALHSRETNFGLRYTLPPGTRAPRPAFLIDAFGDIAEDLIIASGPNGLAVPGGLR